MRVGNPHPQCSRYVYLLTLPAPARWWTYAVLSAVFTALTVVLAKVGMRGIDSSLATAIRLVVALVMAWA